MDERIDLDSLLDGDAPADRQPEPRAETQALTVVETPAVEPTGGKDDAGPPLASAETKDQPFVPRKALEDERRKRQDLENQIKQLTQQGQPQQRQPQHQVHQEAAQFPPRPDPQEDPFGAIEWDRAVSNYHLFETRVNVSQEMMRMAKPDYDQYERIFAEAAQSDPALIQGLQRHPMPAKFAYEMGRQIAFIREVGTDPTAYEERLKQKWLAEQGQSQDAQIKLTSTPVVQAPKSLASTPSTQPRRTNGQFAERAELSDLLGG